MTAVTPAPRIADIHHRFGAFLIDWHIRTIPLALWGFWVFLLWYPGFWTFARAGLLDFGVAWHVLQPILDRPGIALAGWLSLAAYLLYHPVVELLMQGDSPGKRMMNITVRTLANKKPGARQVLLRNLWRAVEFLPFAWLWGAYAILSSPENARTGDVRTGTRVVMTRPE